MAEFTTIPWADGTENPVDGCNGCELLDVCYANQLHHRFPNHPGFAMDFLQPRLFPGRMTRAARWSDLHGTDRPAKPWLNGMSRVIFVSDMGDALCTKNVVDFDGKPVPGGAVPFEFLKREIIDVVGSENGRRHQWLWLSKRPRRMAKFSSWPRSEYGIAWPPNLWAGTSISNQKTLGRIEELKQVGNINTIRFLSIEPLWEQVSIAPHLDGIGWTIAGGESSQGRKARPFCCEWAMQLRDECATAKVPYFLKQLGTYPSLAGARLKLTDRHGEDWEQWPEELRVREMPALRMPGMPAFKSEGRAAGRS